MKRTVIATLLSLTAVVAPTAWRPSNEFGIIPLTADSSLAVVDLRAWRVVMRIRTGPHPQDVVIGRDGRAFALEMGSEETSGRAPGHTVAVIDLASRRLVRHIDISPCQRPHWADIDVDSTNLWVACEPDSLVVQVDVRTSRVTRVVRTGHAGGWMCALAPAAGTLYVAQFDEAGASAISLTTGVHHWIPLSGRPIGIAQTPDGHEVWFGVTGTDSIYVVSVATDSVIARLASPGREPARIVFTPDGSRAVVTLSRGDSVAIFDVRARHLQAMLFTGPTTWPKGVALSRDGSTAYVSLMETGELLAVNVTRGTVVRRLRVGPGPERAGVWLEQR